MLEKETKRLGYDIKVLLKADKLKTVAASFRLDGEEALYASVGYGGVTLNGVMSKLVELYKKGAEAYSYQRPFAASGRA